MTNRSVPPDTVLPHLFYENVPEAIDWLVKNFGFTEHYRHGEPVAGAQLHLGKAWVMLQHTRPGRQTPNQSGVRTQSLTVFVEQVEAHYESVRASGAKIVEDLHETVYGELQYGVEDLAGHLWLFSRHARDVNPADWGATVLNPVTIAG